jgi:cell division topological specificity factor
MFDIIEFITRVFKKEKMEDSRSKARERLKLVLVSDRASMSPQMMESLREELIQVISRYMTIDISSMEIGLERNEGSVALAANIPILNVKRGPKKAESGKGNEVKRTVQPRQLDKQTTESFDEDDDYDFEESPGSSDISLLIKPDVETREDAGKKDSEKSKEQTSGNLITRTESDKDAESTSGKRKKAKHSSKKVKSRTRGKSLRRKI